MVTRKNTAFPYFVGVIVFLLVVSPYMFAYKAGGDEFIFNGFLLNPLDGNSYLAKMYQGYQGTWKFVLPFTSEPGEGAYLFLFYLGLGHLARLLNVPLLFVFHVFRILGCLFLLISLWWFYGNVFKNNLTHKIAFLVSALGSGMGWLAIQFGSPTSDFWVAEAYPFLSSYANPHFPIGLSLLLILVGIPPEKPLILRDKIYFALCAFLLSVINPFGIVLAIVILVGFIGWMVFQQTNIYQVFEKVLIIIVVGLPLLLYDVWITKNDNAFAVWNNQNLTPSPPFWDLFLSFSPVLILSLLGVVSLVRRKVERLDNSVVLLVLWAGLGLFLLYLPFSLQRRFMMGLYIPLVGLGVLGLEALGHSSKFRLLIYSTLLIVLALPTNLMFLLATYNGIQSHDPKIFLDRNEYNALEWIKENTNHDAVILCSPDMGLFVPAYTGRRVIYGHPFETIDAKIEEEAVLRFFSDFTSIDQVENFLNDKNVDYLMIGPRERQLGEILISPNWNIVFTKEDMVLFKVR